MSVTATALRQPLPRLGVIGLTGLAVFLPLALIFYQSLLTAPFFDPAKTFGFGAFAFIFADPDFWSSLTNSLVIAVGMAVIAVPLGAVLAFLMVRTDLPGRGWIEPLLLIPVFVSPMVLGFGYVVAAGPVGFWSVWASDLLGVVPWNVYSLSAIAVIAGLTHVPHVYLYSSAALKSLGSDVEEAARMAGSSPFQVARDVSLPMVTPSLLFSGVLVFFLGFEIFGLPLVLGDPEGHLVLATYLYKLRRWRCASSPSPSRWCCCSGASCATRRASSPSRARPGASGRCRWAAGAGWRSPSSRCGCCSPSSCRCRAWCCARSSRTGARACTWPRCSRWTTTARCSTSRRWCAASSTRC